VIHYSYPEVTPSTLLSDIYLTLRIREPVGGECKVGQGSVLFSRTDFAYDIKHLVAIFDDETTLDGKCAEATLVNSGVGIGGITTHSFCYSAGINDFD
jgi:hypothetical protein